MAYQRNYYSRGAVVANTSEESNNLTYMEKLWRHVLSCVDLPFPGNSQLVNQIPSTVIGYCIWSLSGLPGASQIACVSATCLFK